MPSRLGALLAPYRTTDLARAMGCPSQVISRYRTGSRIPRGETRIRELAKALAECKGVRLTAVHEEVRAAIIADMNGRLPIAARVAYLEERIAQYERTHG